MIRSTFAGFTTAQLALNASQRALDVAGQNIANINTSGYTRQRLDLMSLNFRSSSTSSTSTNQRAGFGVEITGISQVRDSFLDIQYRNQMSKVGSADAKQSILEQLEDIFDETDRDAIQTAFNDLSSQLQKLSQNPGEKSYDSATRASMEVLLNLFHVNETELTSTKEMTAESLKTTDITSINDILSRIQELNASIKTSDIIGNPALELMDERNLLLDELSNYLPIHVTYLENDVGSGHKVNLLNVNLQTTDGNTLTLIRDNQIGSIQIQVEDSPSCKVTSLSLTTAQDDTGNCTTEQLISNQSVLLESGSLKGTIEMLNCSSIFDVPATDTKGFGYYETSMEAMVCQFTEQLNALNIDAAKQLGLNNPEQYALFTKIDTTKDLFISNIQINPEWRNGTISIINTTNKNPDGTPETTDNECILNIINQLSSNQNFTFQTGTTNLTFFTGSFIDCYSDLQNTLAIDTKSTTTLLQSQLNVADQISNSRDNLSGVSLDEEAISLMHYQQSYSAAARLMTALDEALDILINSTGVVGR